jgi:hypothetical protein
MTDDTGKLQGIDPDKPIGKGNPPRDTRFGGKRGNQPNRNGRPRSFDALRKLMQEKAAEIATDADGKPIMRDGKPMTNAEMFVEAWMKDRKQRQAFAAYAWGKPKEELDVTSGGESLAPKVDDERFNRAISSLADALRESVPGKGAKPNGDMDTAE